MLLLLLLLLLVVVVVIAVIVVVVIFRVQSLRAEQTANSFRSQCHSQFSGKECRTCGSKCGVKEFGAKDCSQCERLRIKERMCVVCEIGKLSAEFWLSNILSRKNKEKG